MSAWEETFRVFNANGSIQSTAKTDQGMLSNQH